MYSFLLSASTQTRDQVRRQVRHSIRSWIDRVGISCFQCFPNFTNILNIFIKRIVIYDITETLAPVEKRIPQELDEWPRWPQMYGSAYECWSTRWYDDHYQLRFQSDNMLKRLGHWLLTPTLSSSFIIILLKLSIAPLGQWKWLAWTVRCTAQSC